AASRWSIRTSSRRPYWPCRKSRRRCCCKKPAPRRAAARRSSFSFPRSAWERTSGRSASRAILGERDMERRVLPRKTATRSVATCVPTRSVGTRESRLSWPVLGIILALLAGASLRLIWPEDIEYKADEAWTFQHSRDAALPWLGMPSSVDIPNPGMSVWVFVLLQRLSGAADPPALARAVQLVNAAALVLLVCFAFPHVLRGEREPWLWAAALVAVNPLAVLFHRKIWPPCVLPLLTLAMLYGWWYRRRRGPAFVWGLVGVCLGQIHMAGFFFATRFVLWALLFDRPLR